MRVILDDLGLTRGRNWLLWRLLWAPLRAWARLAEWRMGRALLRHPVRTR